MSKIKIMTDSASDVDKKTAEELDICVVPFSVTYNGKVYTEGVDFSTEEFYDMLSSGSDYPKTSQIKSEQFIEYFNQFYKEGYTDIIYTAICSTGSATYNNSLAARDEFFKQNPDAEGKINIHIIDSHNYTGVYGYPVIEAAVKVKKGCDVDEIIAYIEDWLSCGEVHFVAYTLEYVKRSGRVSAGAAFMGELLGLKPLITIIDGESSVAEKVRGEKNIIPKMIDLAQKNMIPKTPYVLLEGSLRDEYEKFRDAITKTLGYPPERTLKIGATISSHAGPKIIGMVIKGNKRR